MLAPTLPAGLSHAPFHDHRVPPYRCPRGHGGVLLLKRETLCIAETAESRRLEEAVGPEIGAGLWRFSCLFQCCDADCGEVVVCTGEMSWVRDPRLPRSHGAPVKWSPPEGLPFDFGEQMRRDQAELVHEYRPMHFDPALAEDPTPTDDREDVRVADDFSWIVVRGKRYTFRPGNEAKTIGVLWEAWKAAGRQDGCGLTEKTIRDKIDSSADRLRVHEIFKDHEILKDRILRPVGKGQWSLYLGLG